MNGHDQKGIDATAPTAEDAAAYGDEFVPVPHEDEPHDNLALWRAVERTDPKRVKEFSRAGGFRGTAINATYLAKRATEAFGPMGIGWGVDIIQEDMLHGAPLPGGGNTMIHKVLVRLWYELDGNKGAVYQFGQTTFVGANKNGAYTDEEAPKKSLTDGMTKCLSLLGFAADVHMGLYDDNKYVAGLRKEFADKEREEAPKITDKQAADLRALLKKANADQQKFLSFFLIDKITDLKAIDFERAVTMLESKINQPSAPRSAPLAKPAAANPQDNPNG